jgi:hypothetical protein
LQVGVGSHARFNWRLAGAVKVSIGGVTFVSNLSTFCKFAVTSLHQSASIS